MGEYNQQIFNLGGTNHIAGRDIINAPDVTRQLDRIHEQLERLIEDMKKGSHEGAPSSKVEAQLMCASDAATERDVPMLQRTLERAAALATPSETLLKAIKGIAVTAAGLTGLS